MKSYNIFYGDITITKGPSSEEMIKFSEIQGQSEYVTEKIVSDGKEMTENENERS